MTWGLLYDSSLKIHWSQKLGSFCTEVLQYLQRYSNFLTWSKSEGYSPFIELLWGLHKLEMLCKNWVPSINEKHVQIWRLDTQICEKVKKTKTKLWSMYWGLHCHQMLGGKSKNYAVSLLCNITEIWQLLSVSTRNIIHLAVIWVKIWGLHKKICSGVILKITLSPEMDCY